MARADIKIYCRLLPNLLVWYFLVISLGIMISIVNTPFAHEMLQILLVSRLLQGDVTLQEIH